MATVAIRLLAMSADELDELFASSPAGPIPSGIGRGTAIVASNAGASKLTAEVAKALFWQGKVFDGTRHDLTNLITPFSIRAIRAAVYEGPSWVDDKPCIVLDYSKSSIVARPIRDEIRMIGDGEYLGVVFLGKQKVPLRFHLAFTPTTKREHRPCA